MLKLATCFTVELYAYAVMSNHYHMVLHVDPKAANGLSDSEVAHRWITLTPPTHRGEIDQFRFDAKVAALLEDDERLEVCRQRLGDLSWFMRFMNEWIARRANAEDGCKGRFWEARFESKVLLDERAAYTCMVYVDLNPIRAGMTTRLEESDHTSVKRRIEGVAGGVPHKALAEPLRPINDVPVRDPPRLEISLEGYLALVDWTGRMVRDDKPSAIPDHVAPVLARLSGDTDAWVAGVLEHSAPHRRAFGHIDALKALARRLGQHWLKGSGRAKLRPSFAS
jgi:REP element-mobilizing transposase RayT